MRIDEVLDSNFAEIGESWFQNKDDGLLILKFEATWCGPCKMMASSLNELEDDYFGEDVKICSVDIDKANDLCEVFQIQSVPTMVILCKPYFTKIIEEGGLEVVRLPYINGSIPMSELKSVIENYKKVELWKIQN